MRRPVSKNRQIEFVFPVMIFFAFTLSALIVVLSVVVGVILLSVMFPLLGIMATL